MGLEELRTIYCFICQFFDDDTELSYKADILELYIALLGSSYSYIYINKAFVFFTVVSRFGKKKSPK